MLQYSSTFPFIPQWNKKKDFTTIAPGLGEARVYLLDEIYQSFMFYDGGKTISLFNAMGELYGKS